MFVLEEYSVTGKIYYLIINFEEDDNNVGVSYTTRIIKQGQREGTMVTQSYMKLADYY